MQVFADIPPRLVGVVVSLALLGFFLMIISDFGWNPSAVVRFGTESGAYYPELTPPGAVVFPDHGYDALYYYYMAWDLGGGDALVPAVRQQRIGMSALAWLLGLGQPWGVLWVMVASTIICPGLCAWAMASCLREQAASTWPALVAGLNLGSVLNVYFCLNQSLMLCLLALGWLALRRERIWLAASLLGAGLLVREDAGVFVVVFVLWELWRGHFGRAGVMALSFAPWLAWQGYLYWLLSGTTLTQSSAVLSFPGLWLWRLAQDMARGELSFHGWTALPAVLLYLGGLLVCVARMTQRRSLETLLLAASLLALLCLGSKVVYQESITGIGRLGMGVFLWLPVVCARPNRFERWVLLGSLAMALGLAVLLVSATDKAYFLV